MSVEANKAVAREFFRCFTASDLEGALNTLTPDATWMIPGKKDRLPTAGVYSREAIEAQFHRMLDALEDGLEMTVKSCIGEGDSVALEVESRGDLKNGRRYRQAYHMLREYLDTQHAYDVWIAP